jgi:hypothetical protein
MLTQTEVGAADAGADLAALVHACARRQQKLSLLAGLGYVHVESRTARAASITARGRAALNEGRKLFPLAEIAVLARTGCGCENGWRKTYGSRKVLCGCVYRAVFVMCDRKYAEIRLSGNAGHSVCVTTPAGICVSLPCAEYLADFELVARRALAPWPESMAAFGERVLGIRPKAAFNFYWNLHMAAVVGRACLEHGLLPREYFRLRQVCYQGASAA